MALTALAALLAGQGTALAVQGPQLSAGWMAELPAAPDSPLWERASAIYVPLTPQTVALPRLAQVSVARLTARAVHDGRQKIPVVFTPVKNTPS